MSDLDKKIIAIAADRSAESISEIIKKKGGTPVIRSIQGKRLLNEKSAEEDVQKMIKGDFDWVILTTGIGVEALEQASIRIGCQELFIEKLRSAKLAVRGSKAVKWMKNWDLKPTFTSPDGTMEQLIKHLDIDEIEGKQFFFQAYNKDELHVVDQLKALPITLYHSMPYYYIEPEKEVLNDLQTQIVTGDLDAVVFTSKTQVQNLFVNETIRNKLQKALETDVLSVAIGKVTADQLRNQGINRVLESKTPKMGAMIITLANYYNSQQQSL